MNMATITMWHGLVKLTKWEASNPSSGPWARSLVGGHHKGPRKESGFSHPATAPQLHCPAGDLSLYTSGSESSIPGFRSFHTTGIAGAGVETDLVLFSPRPGRAKVTAPGPGPCDGVFLVGELFIHVWQAAR